MANPVHYGVDGMNVACGVSYLVAARKAMEVEDVTCRDCLWCLMAQHLKQANIVAVQLKTLTDEVVS